MKILAIETSCDETAISVVAATGPLGRPRFKVLAHLVSSQTKIHAHWGGVVPSLAKREHAKNLVPILVTALKQAELLKKLSSAKAQTIKPKPIAKLKKILEREPGLFDQLIKFLPTIKQPDINAIAVTVGPGLEPALWVGINLAKALAFAWRKPLIPVNHMAGHIYSVLANTKSKLVFPAVALLVSGGHTELVLIKNWLKYKLLGQTRDDAVGEAFDKVARLLDLPYPGGPEIARLAHQYTPHKHTYSSADGFKLPRPMINSGDLDFSFSGLKTAVLYLVKKLKETGQWNDQIKGAIAHEFQAAAVEVLVAKTLKALEKTGAKTLIVGGGVVANTELRQVLREKVAAQFPQVNLLLSDTKLATDNATMIGIASFLSIANNQRLPSFSRIKAQGNLVLK